METHKRRQNILSLLRESGTLDVDEVAARLQVSPNTIRNDFNALAAEGLLRAEELICAMTSASLCAMQRLARKQRLMLKNRPCVRNAADQAQSRARLQKPAAGVKAGAR